MRAPGHRGSGEGQEKATIARCGLGCLACTRRRRDHMRTLRLNAKGDDVNTWQTFLRDKGSWPRASSGTTTRAPRTPSASFAARAFFTRPNFGLSPRRPERPATLAIEPRVLRAASPGLRGVCSSSFDRDLSSKVGRARGSSRGRPRSRSKVARDDAAQPRKPLSSPG
jgi:hypothetical protein